MRSREIHLEYYNTCDNVVDIFTKPLGKVKFQMFREMLGIHVNPFYIKGSVEDNGEYPITGRVGSRSLGIRISFYFLGRCSKFPKTMYSS